jgi:hypothetical protein
MGSNVIKSEVSQAVEQFKHFMEEGVRNIAKACKLYVSALEADSRAGELFRESCPFISEASWADFELVGRGLMHHELIWGGGKCANKLKALPFSQQKSALEEGIKVLVSNGDTLSVRPDKLTPFQARQTFDGNKIRDVAAQRAWLESLKTVTGRSKKAETVVGGYSIHKGELVVNGPVKFTKQDLVSILGRML